MENSMVHMELKVNGEARRFEGDALNVVDLLRALEVDPSQTGIAVAVNWSVVPRSTWEGTTVKSGDEIEVITARQGG